MKTRAHPGDYAPRRNVVHDHKYQTPICLACGGPTVIFEYNHPAYCPKCGTVPLVRVPETFVADVHEMVMKLNQHADEDADWRDLRDTEGSVRPL